MCGSWRLSDKKVFVFRASNHGYHLWLQWLPFLIGILHWSWYAGNLIAVLEFIP